MGLLTILKKVKQKEQEIRILILGLDNAGYVCMYVCIYMYGVYLCMYTQLVIVAFI